MKTFLYLLLIFASAPACFAQNDDLKTYYEREALSFYGGARFMKAGEVLDRSDVKPLLMTYTASAKEYKLFQKNQRIGNILTACSFVLYVGSLFIIGEQPEAGGAVLIGGVAVGLSTLPFHLKAQKHLQRSLHLYNREMLSKK